MLGDVQHVDRTAVQLVADRRRRGERHHPHFSGFLPTVVRLRAGGADLEATTSDISAELCNTRVQSGVARRHCRVIKLLSTQIMLPLWLTTCSIRVHQPYRGLPTARDR